MSHVIRIPSSIYARLEQHAQGFDSPSNVIEKLLNHYDGVPENSNPQHLVNTANKRDKTKYLFNNNIYGKGRLVLAVIEKYISDHPSITFDELLLAFPKNLQGSIGVFNEISFVNNKYGNKSHQRHFIKENEAIQLSDCDIAVSTEWGSGNINEFVKQAEAHGYSITPTNG